MTLRFLLLPVALAACHAAGKPASMDQVAIVTAVLHDYGQRYSADFCLEPTTIARDGPESIPHDLANRTVTWTHLDRKARGYAPVAPGLAATLTQAWDAARAGNYPAVTLPNAALPSKPIGGCGRTLTLTSPVIVSTTAFVRWNDGVQRRTMALHKDGDSWTVVAEGPARIG